jgi:hypothetical protein
MREQYLERAAQLRLALDVINDPLARHLLVLTIESLEEAAVVEQQRVLTEDSSQHLRIHLNSSSPASAPPAVIQHDRCYRGQAPHLRLLRSPCHDPE